MALSNDEMRTEQSYLCNVYKQICDEIAELEAELKTHFKSIMKTNSEFREDVPILNGGADFDQVVEIYKYNDIVEADEQHYNDISARLRVLRQMRDSAYFGKITFLEDGERFADDYYIGIGTLRDEDSNFLVLDWRAPVCNLYYEYEAGKCGYECPIGTITGELLSKRQFGIFRDKINFAFDTDVLIEDELLCKVLSESRDKKMGNIVKSIQKEQNTAIRQSGAKNLVVFGPAGSGKTSVAMHRAAFLLYKHRDTVTSKNMLVISPNSVFKDYVSDVLPELGENNVNINSIAELFLNLFGNMYVPGHGELMEAVLSGKDNKRIISAKLKSSREFLEIMKRYAEYVDKTEFTPKTIRYQEQDIITAEEISELYYKEWSGMSYAQRLKRIAARAYSVLDEIIEKRKKEIEAENADLFSWEIEELKVNVIEEEFREVRAEIESTFSVDPLKLYANMFTSRAFFDTVEDLAGVDFATYEKMLDTRSLFEEKTVLWEDMFPLMFIKCVVNGEKLHAEEPVKFVFIDEFQDIPPVGLYAVSKLFDKASITLAGDINQTIDTTTETYDEKLILQCLGKSTEVFRLTKSYRSTKEITEYASKLIADDSVDYMDRHGDEVKEKHIPDEKKRIADIVAEIKNTEAKGLNSVGVICRNCNTAERIYDKIKQETSATIVMTDSDRYSSGTTVIPSYLAKGLEFDAVFVFDADEYTLPEELRLYYTVCTRAMHKLVIYK